MRVRKTAVKNEQHRPMIHVVAKPRMGPVPATSRMIPVMSEVRLESKIAEKAFLYPASRASLMPLPPRISSLMRS
ncbi:hypothetical protein EVA_19201 [gut metagenome]|uniref:Uncharacterized protein n=1 Tax=gut metagenome TaxID=749906 RepID=J9FE50_9ZZZZ